MIFVSYFTKNTPYEQVIEEFLIPSLKQFNLPYDIEEVEDRGDWVSNTAYKSKHLLNMLNKHQQAICFLDADAVVTQEPKLLLNLPPNFDIAFHLLNWYGHWRNNWERTDNMHLLSGTMAINYTDKALSLMEAFVKEAYDCKSKYEQKVLQELVEDTSDLNVEYLPAEYCCVLMQDNSIPKYIKDPVIIHTQCSRKYRYWNG